MNIVEMVQFGKILTDREDGKKAFRKISQNYQKPILLDFSGVMSLGSSFGDEVVLKLAASQNNLIEASDTNPAIVNCLRRIEEDSDIKIKFI